MSLNPDIRDQAYQFFIEEAQELLQVLEVGLLDLRQDHSISKVHELMRAAHSIKGGAASVELSGIELLAHRLEDFFKALYSDQVEFDAELESLLLQGYDCLSHPLTEQIETGTFDEEAALLAAEPVFAALEVRLEEALKNADSYIPSSSDLGVDIVASIFEVDVVQGLEHLKLVATNAPNYDPAGELQGQLEVFAGFAELFNLPGFSEIVQTAQTALAQSPHLAVEIINATVADCTIAKEQVLAGDRTQGGSVSPALRALAQTKASEDANPSALESNITGDEITLDQDNLWSDLPANEPLGEDIFATLTNDNPEQKSAEAIAITETDEPIAGDDITLDQDNLWSDLPVVEPLEEDIFATLTDEHTESEFAVETEAAINDDLSEIFNMIPREQAETIEPEAIALDQDNIWLDTSLTEPLVEDIFATIPEAESTAQNDSAINDDLSEIWDIIPGESIPGETNTDTESQEVVDNISQIFEPIPEAEIDIEVQTVADNSALPIVQEISTADDQPQSENLIAAIESIEDIFDSLPSITNEPTSLDLPPETTPTQKPQAQVSSTATSKSAKTAKATKLSVRVDLERLERMNNLVGELIINRNSLALQNEQLQENVTDLGQKFSRFREVTKKLREISDQMLLEQGSQGLSSSTKLTHQTDSVQESTAEVAEFDSLEMDSYNMLYSSLQEMLEEMIQLEESVDDITIFAQQSDRTISSQGQMLDQMRDELMWSRMLPLDRILQRFPRTLRELSNKHQKPVDLKLNGTGVLVDKAVLEKLSDPLLHLLRNGFDHGIEEPARRTEQGKPVTGSIEIHAYYQGNQTVIEVKDDGKGLDLAKITQKGIEQGLITAQEAATATQESIFDLIFEPGFSTAREVSELSGRGVGMNIVRSQIETLKGKIEVASTPGQGSTFTLRLPLTLTIAKLLVCSIGSTAFALPSDSIEEIVIPTSEQVKLANGQKFLSLNSKLIPIYSLKEVLSYNCPIFDSDSSNTTFKTIAPPEDWLAPLLLLRKGRQLFALEIVSLLSEQELVIKPYGKAIDPPSYSYGCTILSDGSLIPVFNGSALISTILGEDIQPIISNRLTPVIADAVKPDMTKEDLADDGMDSKILTDDQITSVKTIMVVDDSTALLRTMTLTLEKEGYRVVQKKDGKEALNGFKQNPDLDLIICDVEMPVMNGFEFLEMRRRDSALSQIPTFMLTSRSGAKHRNLAKQLGANGYFTKPYVEQEFVREVKQILTSNSKLIDHHNKNAIAIKSKTILIIDDSSVLRRSVSFSLERKGYRVLQGRDGREGLEQLRNNLQTDLVICDIEMPNMNGFEFLTTCRKEAALTNIPVVMITSRINEKHRALADKLGVVGFMTKPFVEDKFIQEIEQYIY